MGVPVRPRYSIALWIIDVAVAIVAQDTLFSRNGISVGALSVHWVWPFWYEPLFSREPIDLLRRLASDIVG